MGLDEDRVRLIEAARALVARGQVKFTISAVCAEADVARSAFHELFGGKAALLQALDAPRPEAECETQAQKDPKAAASEPVIPAPDAWLERRLRVFERALTALEAKADVTARAHALAISRLEEQLALAGQPPHAVAEALDDEPALQAEAVPPPQPEPPPAHDILPPEPVPMVGVSKEEMSEVLQAARTRVSVTPEKQQMEWVVPFRWVAIGALSLVALLACVSFTLGASANQKGEGVSIRRAATGAERLTALADSGDAHAQAEVALRYLQGGDRVSAARWSDAAAESGRAAAQYLAGTLSGDKIRAFALFQAAAAQGNVKAMHNLAIAYAQGDGTAKDEGKAADWFARAAERGYVDSAFDLAVLYERGQGVQQDLRQALKWYGVAALAGDAQSQVRAAFLHGQLKPAEARLADAAAMSFAPLPTVEPANRL
jgi:AcrR family transcriptional regulator